MGYDGGRPGDGPGSPYANDDAPGTRGYAGSHSLTALRNGDRVELCCDIDGTLHYTPRDDWEDETVAVIAYPSDGAGDGVTVYHSDLDDTIPEWVEECVKIARENVEYGDFQAD